MDVSVITLSDTDLDSDPDLLSDKECESDLSIECIDLTTPLKMREKQTKIKTPENTDKLNPFYIEDTPSPLTPLESKEKPKEINTSPPNYSSDEEPLSLNIKRNSQKLLEMSDSEDEEQINISDFLKSKPSGQNKKLLKPINSDSPPNSPIINTRPTKRKKNESKPKTKPKGNEKGKVKKPHFHYSELSYPTCPDYSTYSSTQLRELAKEYGMKSSLSDSVYVSKFTEIWHFLKNKQN